VLLLGLIPSKTLLRPGEAIQAAHETPGAREAITGPLDAEQAFAWRDFQVSDYDDAGQVRWMDSNGIDLLRGSARIVGPGRVAVEEATYALTELQAKVPVGVS
jgi:pyruvate/2-oxoglutarate dehydrogenase complex dihydrolipoamide dehydrogenase (E3) component